MEWMDFFIKCEMSQSNIIEWFLYTYVLVQHMEQERKMVVAVVEVLKVEKKQWFSKKKLKMNFFWAQNKILIELC